MNEDNSLELDSILDALSNPHRRQIIYILGLQPRSIKQLAQTQNLSLQAIHRHIKVLEDAGLVVRRKSGRTNFLTLQYKRLRLMQDWINQYHTYWGDGLATMENYVSGIRRDDNNFERESSS